MELFAMAVTLEALDAELREAGGAGGAAPMLQRPPVQKIRYSHAAMADLILANPAISQNELGLHFGYSPSWVSTILCSDAFQSYLAERRETLVDPALRASIEENMKGLVLRSIEVLKEKLDRPTHQIPDQLALRTLEATAKAAGFGARSEQTPPPQSGDSLTILAERLILLNPNRGALNGQAQVIEAQKALPEGPAQGRRTEGADAPGSDQPA